MTSTFISVVFTLTVNLPTNIATSVRNTITWMTILGIHTILWMLSGLHYVIQFRIIQISLNVVFHSTPMKAILFWPRFYYSLFEPKEGRRTILNILANTNDTGGGRLTLSFNRITCLNEKYNCYSFYQTRGEYTHLHQADDKEREDAIEKATAVVYYDDPLHLAVPYTFYLGCLPEPLTV